MSTLAPAPAPHHVHLPSRRRLSQLGFLLGVAAGTVTYFATVSVPPAFLAFVLVWYLVGYGVPQVANHEPHRRQWIAHIAFLPVSAIVIAFLLWYFFQHPFWAVLGGLLASIAIQAGLTRLFLHDVVEDQRHDLRHRIGLE